MVVPNPYVRPAMVAGALSPVLLAVGWAGNEAIDDGPAHGVAVAVLAAALPALLAGLWGVHTHLGLSRMGGVAVAIAIAAPALSLVAGWAAIYLLVALLTVALLLFGLAVVRRRAPNSRS
jgi:hypothetical protein